MAIGFTPKYVEEIFLDGLTQDQFLVLALEASEKMNWDNSFITKSGFVAHTNRGIFGRNAEIQINVDNGIARLKSISTGSEMMDLGKNKKNIRQFLYEFEEFKALITADDLEIKTKEFREKYVSAQDDSLDAAPATTTEKIGGFFSVFIPKDGYSITPIIIDINIIVFVLMAMAGMNILLPDSQILLDWGANFKPLTLAGQAWRLITNCFLHIGVLHLLMNMYALVYIGLLLEPHLGKIKFISAYLLTGILASVTSLWWHDLVLSAGASGAIFGMYGVFLALLTTDLIERNARKSLLTSIGVFVGYNLINGMKGGIDNAAHLGGLISGFMIGYAFIPSLKKPSQEKLEFRTILLVSILVLTVSFVAYKKIPNDVGVYDAKMNRFAALEADALSVINQPANTSTSKLINELNTKGIPDWKEIIELLNSMDKLDLPVALRTNKRLITEYAQLRLKSFEMYTKMLSENNQAYTNDLESLNSQIQSKLDQINAYNKSR